ncbi:hypothetical protein [Solitalea canadensis]|uniref:hypothetical protein n=1 Tax=Solitalea canadensis TaxID=995 RepID=UPI0012FC8745|nr:hypothetical protein [Solitalea canadensis]
MKIFTAILLVTLFSVQLTGRIAAYIYCSINAIQYVHTTNSFSVRDCDCSKYLMDNSDNKTMESPLALLIHKDKTEDLISFTFKSYQALLTLQCIAFKELNTLYNYCVSGFVFQPPQ